MLGTNLEIKTPADRKFSLNMYQGTKNLELLFFFFFFFFLVYRHGVSDVNTGQQGNVYKTRYNDARTNRLHTYKNKRYKRWNLLKVLILGYKKKKKFDFDNLDAKLIREKWLN